MLQWLSMGKYSTAFQMALSRELMYRANFIFGRLRALVIFTSLIFVFREFSQHAQGYSQEELITYIVLAGFFYMVFFVYSCDLIAQDIVEGDLINYLLRPIHYFTFWFCRLAALRTLNIFAALIGLTIILLVTQSSFFLQTNVFVLLQFIVLTVGAFVIITLIDFNAGILSFWTYRSFGPRFMAFIGIQFLSGAYSPLDIFPHWLFQLYNATPFPSIVFVPITAYLGRMSEQGFLSACGVQIVWILALGILLALLWRKGIRSYEATGR